MEAPARKVLLDWHQNDSIKLLKSHAMVFKS